jgi:tetratricopeptide (TPR) repeat protein
VERLHGRLEAVARAGQRLERACSGEGGLLVLTGEPGIGKSRLAEHLAGLAAGAGCTVVWGRCWEAGGAPAYWPWIQVFRGLRMAEDLFAEAGKDVAGNAEQVRFRAFDRAVTGLRDRARQQPLALVLDDLHAADVPSLLLLLLLARELRRSSILVVGAHRDGRAELAPEVAPLLEKIAREGELLPLTRLSPDEVSAWIREALPSASTQQSAAVYGLTEGLPLFVNEVLCAGFSRVTRMTLIDGLRSVLDERLACLPERTREVLAVAAVLGREFSIADVAVTSQLPIDEVDQRLRQARDARVVTLADGAPERQMFSHVLLRDRIYAELPPSRKAALHWAAGLARLARGDDVASAAHHLLEGHSAGDPVRAAATALLAVRRAITRFAFEDAVQLCGRALALPLVSGSTEQSSEPLRLEGELRLALARTLMCMGDRAQGAKVCVRVFTLARQIGAGELFAKATLLYCAQQYAGLGDSSVEALLREALARLPEASSAMRAKVMARLSATLSPALGTEVPEILALAREATALARGLGDDYALLNVLQSVASGLVYLADEDSRFALLEEIIGLARRLDQRMALLERSGWYVAALLGRGQSALAASALSAYEKVLEDFPQPHFRWRVPLAHALFEALRGDFAAADRLNAEAHALAKQGESAPGLRAWAVQRMSFALMRGEPQAMAPFAPEMLVLFEPGQAQLPSPALVLAATGQHEPAARRLKARKHEFEYFPALVLATETCLLLGDRELGATLYARLAAVASSHPMFWGPVGASAFGPTSRLLGDLALLTGRAAEALQHYADAIELCERIGARPFIALAAQGQERARALLQRSTPPAGAPVSAQALRAPLGLHREGDVWSIESSAGRCFRLKHSKGLSYLQSLMEQPGRQVHVLELAGVEHAAGDAGPVLDARAKAEYRERLGELSEELREAERFGDPGRRERAQRELDALAEQLASAVGYGGKDRLVASDIERARINVQRRLKDTLERIGAHDPALARYLSAAVQTGTYCCFDPARAASDRASA